MLLQRYIHVIICVSVALPVYIEQLVEGTCSLSVPSVVSCIVVGRHGETPGPGSQSPFLSSLVLLRFTQHLLGLCPYTYNCSLPLPPPIMWLP